MRDLGSIPSPMNAFLLNVGLETLDLRIRRHSENALRVARYLESRTDLIESVSYPGLESSPEHEKAMRYLEGGMASGVVSFSMKGGREKAMRFMDSLRLAEIVVHVADIRTGVLHPASMTHRQLSEQELIAAGVSPDLIRVSVGIEHIDDLKADFDQALRQV